MRILSSEPLENEKLFLADNQLILSEQSWQSPSPWFFLFILFTLQIRAYSILLYNTNLNKIWQFAIFYKIIEKICEKRMIRNGKWNAENKAVRERMRWESFSFAFGCSKAWKFVQSNYKNPLKKVIFYKVNNKKDLQFDLICDIIYKLDVRWSERLPFGDA